MIILYYLLFLDVRIVFYMTQGKQTLLLLLCLFLKELTEGALTVCFQ